METDQGIAPLLKLLNRLIWTSEGAQHMSYQQIQNEATHALASGEVSAAYAPSKVYASFIFLNPTFPL